MSYRKEAFQEWLKPRVKNTGTVANYTRHLDKFDGIRNDLDEKLEKLGTDGFLKWMKEESFREFCESAVSDNFGLTCSALKKYVIFNSGIDAQQPDEAESDLKDDIQDETATEPRLFQLEKEMQAAVRKQLGELEPGLKADDDGKETKVATGRIDIVARDRDGKPVVIELKAGQCPDTALTQVLGYAADLEKERGEEVRAYLVAGSFPDRTRAAARKTIGLELRTYEFSVRFNALTDQ